jgi:broad specificity phosphatase PhoE
MLTAGVTLYFVRHGETDWNVAQRYQGQRDIPINATGRIQAKRNGAVLCKLLGVHAASLDYVSSPLLRATETMEIIRRELSLPAQGFRTDGRISEIDYGHWAGQLWNDLPLVDANGFKARAADPWDWQPRDGESYHMLSDRVALWLAEVKRDTIATAHGGVSRVLRGLVLRLETNSIPLLEVPQDKVLVVSAGSAHWL